MPVLIPRSLDEALSMLSTQPEATMLSGGTDLMVEVNFNHRRPETVIALKKVNELATWSVDQDKNSIFIGAGVTHGELETGTVATILPALAQACRTVGSPQIRAAGTIGGNLGTCSPAGDTLPVLSALNAVVHLQSQKGERQLPFQEFMTGPKRNARNSAEIITGVTVPIPDGKQGYAKVGVRNAMVISVASASVVVHQNSVRVALGSVGPTIIRCTEAENWLNSLQLDLERVPNEVAKEFGQRVSAESRPIDDHRSTAQYRRHAVGVLAQRLIQRSAS